MTVNKQALIKELQRRKEVMETPPFSLDAFMFTKQQEFFRGEGPRFRAACCSRRAGKTVGIVGDMLDTALEEPGSRILYITQTQMAARDIIWADLKEALDKYNIDCKTDDSRLTVTFPNKSKIWLKGAKDLTEVRKFRGYKLRKCYIDEAQSMRASILEELINDVIIPALRDLEGDLYMTGTPGPVKAGPFYEKTHSDKWYNVHWTAYENPYMNNQPDSPYYDSKLPEKDLDRILTEEREMREIDENDPSYIRETYGRWVEDSNSLVYKFNKNKNVYQTLPTEGQWTYIMGVDIGYNDADAIAVIGFNHQEKNVYLIDEVIKAKQNITELVKVVKRLKSKYDPVSIVMDAGALGKKIQEEIRSRHGLSMHAAEKTRKFEFIELLNDDLRTGRFLAPASSVFEEESYLVTWDRESLIRNPERPKISDAYHSDIHDAVLYAWRECKHYLSQKDVEVPKLNTDKYMEEMEAKEAEDMQRMKDSPDDYALEKAMESDMEELESILDIWKL